MEWPVVEVPNLLYATDDVPPTWIWPPMMTSSFVPVVMEPALTKLVPPRDSIYPVEVEAIVVETSRVRELTNSSKSIELEVAAKSVAQEN